MKSWVVLLASLCLLPHIAGLMCYWCSGVGNDRDCERKPLGIKSGPSNVNCSSKFCTTAKVMDLENGEVKSFARFCDNVYRGNRCVKDTKLMTCYQACVFDHCNNGNPSPKYLRIENLLQPDLESKNNQQDEVVSTSRDFHFFTAPPDGSPSNNVLGKNGLKEEPKPFKEQSIFKAFTTLKPSTTMSTIFTTSEAATTSATSAEPDSTSLTRTTFGGQQKDDQVSTKTLIDDSQETVSDTQGTSTVNIGTSSPEPSSPTVPSGVDVTSFNSDPDGENVLEDLGSEAPVDSPDSLQQDSPSETLSPEPVKDQPQLPDTVRDVQSETKKDVIYTTPKPSTTSIDVSPKLEKANGIETNMTKAEELNLAATRNATDTSGASISQKVFVSIALFSLVCHIL